MGYTGDKKREYQLAWIKKRRDDYFLEKWCFNCGSIDKLELDHINPATKLYDPALLWGMADSNLRKIAELAKCQVLCYDCHIEKTSIQFSFACEKHRKSHKKCDCDAG